MIVSCAKYSTPTVSAKYLRAGHKIALLWPLIKALFKLLPISFTVDLFLLLKTELFFLPAHITPFLNKNKYLSSAVFTLVLKNGSDHLLFVFALCSLFSLFPDYVSVFVCYQCF